MLPASGCECGCFGVLWTPRDKGKASQQERRFPFGDAFCASRLPTRPQLHSRLPLYTPTRHKGTGKLRAAGKANTSAASPSPLHPQQKPPPSLLPSFARRYAGRVPCRVPHPLLPLLLGRLALPRRAFLPGAARKERRRRRCSHGRTRPSLPPSAMPRPPVRHPTSTTPQQCVRRTE